MRKQEEISGFFELVEMKAWLIGLLSTTKKDLQKNGPYKKYDVKSYREAVYDALFKIDHLLNIPFDLRNYENFNGTPR